MYIVSNDGENYCMPGLVIESWFQVISSGDHEKKGNVKPWSHQAYVHRAGCLRAVYGRKPWRSQDHLAGASRSWPQP